MLIFTVWRFFHAAYVPAGLLHPHKKDTENNVFQCLFLIFGNFIRSTEPVDVPFVNQLFDLVRQAGS